MRNVLFAAAGLAMGAGLTLAQNQPPASGVPVQVIVTVEAREGKSVPALNPEDILVFEGHDRARATGWIPFQGEHAGLELYVLMDDSLSSSVGLQLSDIRRFIEQQPATTAVGTGYMRNGMADIQQAPTADHTKAANSLRIPMGTMASPYLALSDLMQRWPAGSPRREVLMITSGDDPLGGNGPMNPYLDTAIEQAQRAGILVYAIYTPGIGHARHSYWRMNWDQNHLAQLTEETGGEGYLMGFGPPVSFAPYLDDLAERLTHQYLLTFLAKSEKKASFQSVKLSTEVPNAELVGPNRVWVPVKR
jgi:hypothetical protein